MEFTSAAPELIVYKSFKRFHTSFVIKIVMPNPDSFYKFPAARLGLKLISLQYQYIQLHLRQLFESYQSFSACIGETTAHKLARTGDNWQVTGRYPVSCYHPKTLSYLDKYLRVKRNSQHEPEGVGTHIIFTVQINCCKAR